MMKKILLWLDDLRDPIEFISQDISRHYMIIWVKSVQEFKAHINTHGLPDMISFDHDLGTDEDGYDAAKFLCDYCVDNGVRLPVFRVHSANPVGAKNIQSLLNNFNKHVVI